MRIYKTAVMFLSLLINGLAHSTPITHGNLTSDDATHTLAAVAIGGLYEGWAMPDNIDPNCLEQGLSDVDSPCQGNVAPIAFYGYIPRGIAIDSRNNTYLYDIYVSLLPPPKHQPPIYDIQVVPVPDERSDSPNLKVFMLLMFGMTILVWIISYFVALVRRL